MSRSLGVESSHTRRTLSLARKLTLLAIVLALAAPVLSPAGAMAQEPINGSGDCQDGIDFLVDRPMGQSWVCITVEDDDTCVATVFGAGVLGEPPVSANCSYVAAPPMVIPPSVELPTDRVAACDNLEHDRINSDVSSSDPGYKSYWFTMSWDSGSTNVNDYTTWTFYRINGRNDLFFVRTKTTASAVNGQSLIGLYPWLRRGSSRATLGDWDPYSQIVGNGAEVTLSLSHRGAGISTKFKTVAERYDPRASGAAYGVIWRGHKGDGASVGVKHLSRWYAGGPGGMLAALCGYTSSFWGYHVFGNCDYDQ